MPRRHVIARLSDDEFEFVIGLILDGCTDREIVLAFQDRFGKRLARSSLRRWREAAGDELAERYRLARYQARQLLEDIKAHGQDAYQVIIQSIEDRLLTATREVIAHDPIKLLQIRQEEERRRLKEQELTLKRQQLELEREKLRKNIDRVALSVEFMNDLLEYVSGRNDPDGLRWIRRHIKPFSEFVQEKYAAA